MSDDLQQDELRAREIVAAQWDAQRAESVRVLGTRPMHCARVVETRRDGERGRVAELSDAPASTRFDFRWEGPDGAPAGYREAPLSGFPDGLRARIDKRVRRFERGGGSAHVQAQVEHVAECSLGGRERLWVGLESGHVLAYDNPGIGAKRWALGLGAVAFIVLGPLLGCLIDPWVGGGVAVAAFLLMIVLMIHFSGSGGDGGARAWMNVR